MTLSDTQLLILSAASQRNDHAAILPASLKGSAAKKVIDRLLKQKLLQELRAKDDMPVWRRGHDNRPYTLRITKGGLKAIEVEDVADAPDENATPGPDEVVATNAPAETNLKGRPGRARRSSSKKAAAPTAKATKASSGRPSPDTKQDRVVALLQQPGGAALDVLVGQRNRMAETLGTRLLGRHGAQEAETSTDLRKGRRYQDLSDRGIQSREGR